jgi:tRNA(Arg) A34 adenosine deaminase TadA
MSELSLSGDEYFMRLAIREAERAREHGDVPIGAVVERAGEVVAVGSNERELRQDPTAHAEVLALREAANAPGRSSWHAYRGSYTAPAIQRRVRQEACSMCSTSPT